MQAVLFASLILASCNSKEIASPDDESSNSGIPFEVSTVITKTTNADSHTKWAESDAINLFHAEAGATTYTSDGKFTVDEGLNGVFSGTLGKALEDGKNYDWYAFYPYTSQITTPANKSARWVTVGGTSQIQTANDSRAHLAGDNCPLYGVVTGVASSDMPAFAMNQLTSVVAVNVTNTLSEALTVSSVSFTSTEDIVGTYYIDITGDAPAYTSSGNSYVSKTATLTVKDGTAIAQGETAKFYIAIKPHTVASGSTLTVSVNGVEKTLTIPSDVTFTAGHIKTVKYSYEGTTEVGLALPFKEDFAASTTSDNSASVSDFSQFSSFTNIFTGGDGVLRVGKSKGKGIMTTVPLDLSTESTVIIRAKRWSGDTPAIRVTVNGVNYDTEKLSDEYKDYFIYLPVANSYAPVTITSDTQYRYYIDNLEIVSGKVTPPVIETSETSVTLSYNDEEVKNMSVSVSDGDVSCGVYDDEAGSIETSWCSAVYSLGQVSYLAASNTGATTRTAYIIIAATNSYGTTKVVIPVKQEANSSGTEYVLIIDASQLPSKTATTEDVTKTYSDIDIVFSAGAKQQVATSAKNYFSSEPSILIGKTNAYIYNKTAIPGKITKFEIYANYGASAKVTVGVNFSAEAITSFSSSASNTYTATLSKLDSVYDCSSALPDDAKYFWYQVTNNNNSQVQFRITYIKE